MNHWKETAEIVARLGEIEAAGHRAALATVVRIVGSAYRRPGAKLLVEEGGGSLGSVSGGCLEADVREVAKAVLDSGQPWLRHYDTADESILWGLGLGCNGSVDVLVQPATTGPLKRLLPRLGELFAGDAPFALATLLPGGTEPPTTTGASPSGGGRQEANAGAVVLVESGGLAAARGIAAAGPGRGKPEPAPRELTDDLAARAQAALAAGASGVQEAGGRRIFVEVQQPPPHLLVCGAGDDAKPLVAYAADVGFRVTVIDHRPALLDPAWFAPASRRVVARPEDLDVDLPAPSRSLAVVKTHSLHHDREWVRRLLAAGLPYIGVLGPRARTESILRDVGAGGAGAAGAVAGAADAVAAARTAGAAARQGAWGTASADGGRPAAAERVFGPVGLDLGADGPRQVAVSIVAELLAFTAHREPRHLSERREAIHAG